MDEMQTSLWIIKKKGLINLLTKLSLEWSQVKYLSKLAMIRIF